MPGCKQGEQKDEIAMLIEKQAFITAQRDSLIKFISVKTTLYDTIFTKYNNLIEENNSLKDKNKSLQSAYRKKDEQFKKISEENASMNNALNEKSYENDSLLKVIEVLELKLNETNNQKTEAEQSNVVLAQTIQEKELKITADSIAKENMPKPARESGFVSISEIGGGFGLGDVSVDYSRQVVTINTIAGYRINNHFIAGIGTGVNIYNGGTMIPLYLDFRYKFNEGNVTPFFVADGGLLFHPDGLSSSGLFINPAFGITKKLTDKVSFHISGGMLLQEAPQGMRNSFFNLKGGITFRGK
jgi:hypothetical protein